MNWNKKVYLRASQLVTHLRWAGRDYARTIKYRFSPESPGQNKLKGFNATKNGRNVKKGQEDSEESWGPNTEDAAKPCLQATVRPMNNKLRWGRPGPFSQAREFEREFSKCENSRPWRYYKADLEKGAPRTFVSLGSGTHRQGRPRSPKFYDTVGKPMCPARVLGNRLRLELGGWDRSPYTMHSAQILEKN